MDKGILISVKDNKADTWTPPQCSASRAAAIREFETVVNSGNTNSMLCSHPEDFALFELGTFDRGIIVADDSTVCLATGDSVKRSE